jgi:hypothetical protein
MENFVVLSMKQAENFWVVIISMSHVFFFCWKYHGWNVRKEGMIWFMQEQKRKWILQFDQLDFSLIC